MYKILVLSHMYPTVFNSVFGVFVHEQVRGLTKQGCQIKVVSPVPWTPFPVRLIKKKWQHYARIKNKEIKNGIEIFHPRYICFPYGYFSQYSGKFYYQGIKRVVDLIYRNFKFDLIHAHGVLPDGFSAILLKKRYHKPVVMTVHGVDVYATIHKSDSCKKAIAKTLRKADRIITVGSPLKDKVACFISGDKVAVVNNGVNLSKIFKGKSILRSKYDGKKIILSVGSLIERKAHRYVLKALKELINDIPNVVYLIIGDGPEKKRLQKCVKALKLDQYVEFVGVLPHKNVMEYMSICDIFVLSSWDEGFGVVYVEAMAHGKPVIGCNGEGIEDVVTNSETGVLVKAKDVKELKAAMLKLLKDEKYAQKLGEKGRNLVIKNFTWKINAKKNIRIYEEVLGGKNQRNGEETVFSKSVPCK